MDVQARHLVDHHLAAGVGWGRLYREAASKGFWAEHQTNEERWYTTIVSELRMRGTLLFCFFFLFSASSYFLLLRSIFSLRFLLNFSTFFRRFCPSFGPNWPCSEKTKLIDYYAQVIGAALAGMP